MPAVWMMGLAGNFVTVFDDNEDFARFECGFNWNRSVTIRIYVQMVDLFLLFRAFRARFLW